MKRWSETQRVAAALRALPLDGEFVWRGVHVTRIDRFRYRVDLCDRPHMPAEDVVAFLQPD